MDEVYSVIIKGYVIKKDYMDKPDTWDWAKIIQQGYFASEPDIKITKLEEIVIDTYE
jgi:hypothetical protein